MLKSHINEKQAATTSWALSLTHNGSFSILHKRQKEVHINQLNISSTTLS